MSDQQQFERERRARDIFMRVMDLPSPEARQAFLNEQCLEDSALRDRVEILLRNNRPDSFLEEDGAQALKTLTGDSANTEAPGARIGHYKLLQKIGEGGMGVVYMAEQVEPIRRRVALKIIKLGMDTRAVVARFDAERQALALMDHPNIAKVLDAGATDGGRPYFVMDLVQGVPITEFCDRNHLSPEERLQLFIPVCQAIQHAHQKGIIHRDIKPSNVMVTLHDGRPVPKVIDFGVAKAINQRLTEKTLFTNHATMIGTPAYMSPEQAEMSGLDVDTRTDVYALGVLLYELLTGTTPFPQKELLNLSYGEMQRAIVQNEPLRPSTRVSTMRNEERTFVAKNRNLDPHSLSQLFEKDLDWVVMKCLEKDRARRYETANALAADIQRHLASEPVAARPPSAAYRLQKAIRRNKAAFAGASAVVLALVIGASISLWQAIEKSRALSRALAAEREQARSREAAEGAARRAEQNAGESRQQLRRLQVANGARLLEEGDFMDALPWFVEAFKTDRNHPENEAHHRLRIASTFERCPRPVQVWFLKGEVPTLSVSPDGTLVLGASSAGTAALWNLHTGQELVRAQFTPPPPGIPPRTGFSADGSRAFAEGGSTAIIFDAKVPTHLAPEIVTRSGIGWSAISLDGRYYVTSGSEDRFVLWNAANGERIKEIDSVEPQRFTFLSPEQAKALFEGTFDQSAQLLLATGPDPALKLWDLTAGKVVHRRVLEGYPDPTVLGRGTFSADGRFLIMAGDAKRNFISLLWDVRTGRLIGQLPHEHHVYGFDFSPDNQTLVTCSQDRTARIWDTRTGALRVPPLRHEQSIYSVSISPGGQFVVTGGRDGVARVWDSRTGEQICPPLKHISAAPGTAFGKDDSVVVTGDGDGTVRVWDLAAGPKWKWGVISGVLARKEWFRDGKGVALSPDQRYRVEVGRNDAGESFCQIQDTATGQRIAPPLRHLDSVIDVVFSSDSQRVLIASADNRVQVWDVATGRPAAPAVPSPRTLGQWGMAIFGPDDRSIVCAHEDGTARIWDAFTSEPLTPPFVHGDWIKTGAMNQFAMLMDGGKTLYTYYTEPRFWEIPSNSRPVEHWERVARFLSARRLDISGSIEPLDRTTFSNLWTGLRADVPEDFSFSRARRHSWHIWRAELNMARWHAASALPHLDELVKAEPDRFRFRWLRSRAHEGLDQWPEMAEDLRAAIQLLPGGSKTWTAFGDATLDNGHPALNLTTRLAAAELASGNQSAFEAACAVVLMNPSSADSLDVLAWTARVLTHGGIPSPLAARLGALVDPLEAEAEKAHERGDRDLAMSFYRTLGAVRFREGRFIEAQKWLAKAAEIQDAVISLRCFLAMTHRKLGNDRLARNWLERARLILEATRDQAPLGVEIPATFALRRLLVLETEACIKESGP